MLYSNSNITFFSNESIFYYTKPLTQLFCVFACVCLWISLKKNQTDQTKPDNSKFLHRDSSFCQVLAYFFPFKNCMIDFPLVHTVVILL